MTKRTERKRDTPTRTWEKAANGFEALADLDSNHDGVFDGDDEAFGEIKVWQDLNQNGVVDDGELKAA